MMRHKIFISILILFVFILSLGVYAQTETIENDEINILMISSYSPSFMTFFHQIDGVKSVLDELDVILDIEFMDSKRFYTEENLSNFLESLSYKIAQQAPYDVIITSDDNALNFVLEYKEQLFPNISIVFLGVNNIENAQFASSDPLITGVVEASSIGDTIRVAQNLNKGANNVIAITDNTNSGQGDLARYYALENEFTSLDFKDLDLSDYSFEEFKGELEKIDDDSIVLLLSLYSDKTNARVDFFEGLDLLIDHCDQPIYHPYYHGIDDGVIGGKVISHFEQGKEAGLMVRDILKGVPVATIPLLEESPNRYIFDNNILEQHGINRNDLPPVSEIINYEKPLFIKYIYYIIGIALVIFIQASMIVFLVQTIRMKNRAEARLKKNHDMLENKNIEIEELNQNLEEKVENRTSELEAAMQELTATLEDLESTQESLFRNKMVESFLNLSRKLSHQINTPLGVSLTSATYISKRVENVKLLLTSKTMTKRALEEEIEQIESSIKIINGNLERSIKVINALQKYTKFEPLKLVNINEVVIQLVRQLKSMPLYYNINIQTNIDEYIHVNIQEKLFATVLESLLENAVCFNEDIDVVIKIDVKKDDEKLQISVSDNGKGISSEIADEIFEPFFSTNPHRIGMGLFLVKNIIHETLNGKLYLDPSYQEGSKFVIEFDVFKV